MFIQVRTVQDYWEKENGRIDPECEGLQGGILNRGQQKGSETQKRTTNYAPEDTVWVVAPEKDKSMSSPLGPRNVTLFGKRIFAEIIKDLILNHPRLG